MIEVVSERRISAKAFLGHHVAAVVAGIAVAAVCFAAPIPGVALLAPAGLLPLLGTMAYARLTRAGSCYRLFTDRLEVESGLVARNIDNLELVRVRDVSLRQGLYGRMTDVGDVIIHSTDASSPQILVRGVDAPRDFYQQVRECVSESRAQNRTMIVEEGVPLGGH